MTAPADPMTAGGEPAEPSVADPELIADPYGGYGRIREEAPVRRGRFLDGSAIWFVTRYEDVRTVLSDPRIVNNANSVPGITNVRAEAVAAMGISDDLAPYLTGTILDTDAPDHTRLRKLVSRAFTVRRVNELRPRVERITADLLDRLSEHADADGVVDLIEHFAYPLPITVICELVGVPEAERPQWRVWGTALMSMQPDLINSATREMIDYIHGLIERRRAELEDTAARSASVEGGGGRQEGLLSALIRTHDEDGDRLNDTELVSMVLTLVLAGHETTAHLIGNGTAALLNHPDQLARLRADDALLPKAVHELMRTNGTAHLTRLRYAAEDIEIGGTTIRRGEAIQPVLVSANFDPRHFDDPDRLDITREAPGREQHMGFGHGIHYCLGAALARQEGEVAFGALLKRFPGLELAVAPDELEWAPLPGNRRLNRLPVRV